MRDKGKKTIRKRKENLNIVHPRELTEREVAEGVADTIMQQEMYKTRGSRRKRKETHSNQSTDLISVA